MMIYQDGPVGHVVTIAVVLADIVEDQVVFLQAEAQRQRQQEQDAREDVRMLLHVSGEFSVTGTIPCCYVCNRSSHVRSVTIVAIAIELCQCRNN